TPAVATHPPEVLGLPTLPIVRSVPRPVLRVRVDASDAARHGRGHVDLPRAGTEEARIANRPGRWRYGRPKPSPAPRPRPGTSGRSAPEPAAATGAGGPMRHRTPPPLAPVTHARFRPPPRPRGWSSPVRAPACIGRWVPARTAGPELSTREGCPRSRPSPPGPGAVRELLRPAASPEWSRGSSSAASIPVPGSGTTPLPGRGRGRPTSADSGRPYHPCGLGASAGRGAGPPPRR